MATIYNPRCAGTYNGRPCRKKFAEFITAPAAFTCARCDHVTRF